MCGWLKLNLCLDATVMQLKNELTVALTVLLIASDHRQPLTILVILAMS